ncbi:Pollen receptor-like kinase 3 [Bienertia sinuspersici]
MAIIIAYHTLNPFLLPYFTLLILLSTKALSITDAESLSKFKASLMNSEPLSSWDLSTSPCSDKATQWNGIICYEGIVIGLRLKSMGLSGKIDVEALSNLQGLRTISFENNKFTGPIPDINRLGALKAVYLTNNQFSGPIPFDYFSKMESLKKLWLANNSFTGEIPSSLAQLRNLVELHLENNQFSGVIPPLKQPPLVSLDLSNNQLQGEIPMSLANFKASSFDGNPNLCGALVLGKDCTAERRNQSASEDTKTVTQKLNQDHHPHNKRNFTNLLALVVSVTLVLLSLIVVAIFVTNKKKQEQQEEEHNNIPTKTTSSNNTKNNANDGVVEVDVVNPTTSLQKDHSPSQSSTHSSSSKSRSNRGSGKGGKGGAGGGSGNIGDLTMVNEEKGVFGLADLMKASAEVLGNGGMGSAYKAVMSNGLAVVVKRMRELNSLEKDAFDKGIRRLASLRHKNILPPLAFHYRKEEKLVVYEYVAKGSLHYILHGDRGTSHEELNWPTRLNIIKGITEGLTYLHSQLQTYDLPHGNLKSSNIMINSQNEALLSDYGFSPMVSPSVATHALFGNRSPEVIQNQTLLSPKCDVYCLGVVILEIITCKFPSQYLSSTKGGTDVVQWVASAIEEAREAELIDPDILSKSEDYKESMVNMLHIGVACTEPYPDKRPSLSEIKERIERVDVQDMVVV